MSSDVKFHGADGPRRCSRRWLHGLSLSGNLSWLDPFQPIITLYYAKPSGGDLCGSCRNLFGPLRYRDPLEQRVAARPSLVLNIAR
jgi:hypothetical protein